MIKTIYIQSVRHTKVGLFGGERSGDAVNGRRLAKDIEIKCQKLIEQGYSIMSVFPINSGGDNYSTSRSGYGYGYGFTSGVIIIAKLTVDPLTSARSADQQRSFTCQNSLSATDNKNCCAVSESVEEASNEIQNFNDKGGAVKYGSGINQICGACNNNVKISDKICPHCGKKFMEA